MGTSIHSKIRSVASGFGLLLLVASGSGYGADGTGNVYLQNPVVDPVVHSVALTNLDGGGFLVGDAADVINPVIARAYSAALDFSYAPDFPVEDRIHFGEVMAYYHITEYYKYAISLGVAVPGGPVGVDVFNAKPSGSGWVPITSAYDSTTGRISLETIGDFEDSDAIDGDMILHEYAHALQHTLRGGAAGWSVWPETTASEQAAAIMEGHADFVATSRFDDPQWAEHKGDAWDRLFMRNVDNFHRWPDDFGEGNKYRTGMIFSGAIWDLRSVVGSQVADSLAFKAVETVPDNDPGSPELNTTFVDALSAIRQADIALYGGAHDEEIEQAFAVHGIGTYDFSTAFPMVRDPGDDYEGLQAHTVAGASVVAVTFDEFVTKLDDATFTTDEMPLSYPGFDEKDTIDYLEILDGTGAVVGMYTGRELQGETIVVLGDTAQFHLVTDSYRAPFGYRVLDIKSVLLGDANLDDCVDGLDYVIWSNNYDPLPGEKIWQQGDHNGDGIVDGLDYVVWSNHYLEGCPPGMVPEPATLSLLAIGAAALVLCGKRRPRSAPGKELVPRGA